MCHDLVSSCVSFQQAISSQPSAFSYFFFFGADFFAAGFFAAAFFAGAFAALALASAFGAISTGSADVFIFFGFASFFESSGAVNFWPLNAISVIRTAVNGCRWPAIFLYCFFRL